MPKRSLIGFGLLSLLAAFDFWYECGRAIQYHGRSFALGTLSAIVVMIGVGWVLLLRARRLKTFGTTLSAHAWVVGWLVWQAYPWLGELCC